MSRSAQRASRGLCLACLLSCLSPAAKAQSWTGAAGNNWTTAGNWLGGAAPVSSITTAVTFGADAITFTPFADSVYTLNRIDFLLPGFSLGGFGLTLDGASPSISVLGSGNSIDSPMT